MKTNKTKKLGKVNGNTLIAAIDIGKKMNYGYFRAPDGLGYFSASASGHVQLRKRVGQRGRFS